MGTISDGGETHGGTQRLESQLVIHVHITCTQQELAQNMRDSPTVDAHDRCCVYIPPTTTLTHDRRRTSVVSMLCLCKVVFTPIEHLPHFFKVSTRHEKTPRFHTSPKSRRAGGTGTVYTISNLSPSTVLYPCMPATQG